MLKRVAVIGAEAQAIEDLSRGAESASLEFIAMEPDSALPLGTLAILASGSAGDAAVHCEELGRQQEVLLNLLCDSIDAREGILIGSGERLREHATRFALALDLSSDDRLTLERGALLRDVGKIRIPNDVLLKKSVLTYDEWVLLQQHTTLGADLLIELNFATEVAEIARYHHECWDGDGYPDHLERDAIPYLARVMKIIDVYCAMTSPRHYRATHSSHEDALIYLESERGKHYDPELLDIFLNGNIARPLHSD